MAREKARTLPRVLVEQRIGDGWVGLLLEEFDLNQAEPYRSLIFAINRSGILERRFATKTEAAAHQWKYLSDEVKLRQLSRQLTRDGAEKILREARKALAICFDAPVGESQ